MGTWEAETAEDSVMRGVQTDYRMARARARLPEIEASVRRINAPNS